MYGELRDDQDKKFQYNVFDDREKNERRYEKLGTVITNYIYEQLQRRCKLKRVGVSLSDNASSEEESFIFVSDGALKKPNKLLILIHGAGMVRAGQWARRIIINDNLEAGTQMPYIEKACRQGYEVIVLNTNLNINGKGTPIKGSETPEFHAVSVWKNLVKNGLQSKSVAIVAHSYGGVVTANLALVQEEFLDKVYAIAFTDSVHNLDYFSSPRQVKSFFAEHSRNWVTSNKPLNTLLQSPSSDSAKYSAGVNKHEWTSHCSIDPVFEFLEEEYTKIRKTSVPAANSRCQPNTTDHPGVHKSHKV